jgi:hypothetical protein
VRGFGDIENSLSAFEKACSSQVPYLEVDTRVSLDGEIYISHSPIIRNQNIGRYRFKETESSFIDKLRYINGEPPLTLKNALKLFKGRKYGHQKLCIDIKDYGFEKEHFEMVKKAYLEDHVYFISWIPQTLIRLYELGGRMPLILSHWNIIKLGAIGSFISKVVDEKIIRFSSFVIIGERSISKPLGSLEQGFQHTLICQRLPNDILNILLSTKGGICIHCSMLGDKVLEYCRENNLRLWIFSVDKVKDYVKYASNTFIDVIFCENADFIFKALIE